MTAPRMTPAEIKAALRDRRQTADKPPTTDHGLGDAVEAWLSSIGITKRRYREVKRLFGLPPTCACDARQAWLNRVSDWWRERMKADESG